MNLINLFLKCTKKIIRLNIKMHLHVDQAGKLPLMLTKLNNKKFSIYKCT